MDNSPLSSYRDTVVSALDGRELQADIFMCGRCQSPYFGVFQILGTNHMHLQCARCHTSYCPAGSSCHEADIRRSRRGEPNG